jgi:hypothetical protein
MGLLDNSFFSDSSFKRIENIFANHEKWSDVHLKATKSRLSRAVSRRRLFLLAVVG